MDGTLKAATRTRSLDLDGITQIVGQKFHGPRAPTVVALARPTGIPIIVSHVVGHVPMAEKSLVPPIEPAFAIHVHHKPLASAETCIDGKHASLPPIAP